MTSSNLPTVPGELFLEALAALDAAGSVINELEGFYGDFGGAISSGPGDFFSNKAFTLKDEAFGTAPDSDEAYNRDPVIVELYARTEDLVAEALGCWEPPSSWHAKYTIGSRAKRHAKAAEQIREAGDIDAMTAFADA